jgi:hypothetical protein
MLIGAHSIIHSIAPEADRAFLGEVLRLPNVDVGEGWLDLRIAAGRSGRASEAIFMLRTCSANDDASATASRTWGDKPSRFPHAGRFNRCVARLGSRTDGPTVH